MINSKFGFSGINEPFSSTPSIDNINRRIENLFNKFIPVRVIDVILDETHPEFEIYGGWNGVGTIKYELINSPEREELAKNIAKPLSASNKSFPLKNEIVLLTKLPDINSLNNLTDNEIYYYLNIVSLWNHPHHNAFPNLINNSTLSESQRKDYKSIENGNVRRVTDNSTEINLNSTNNNGGKFIEKTNIHPILPFTGDNILEGRFGNSIRLGSTIKSKSQYQNNWSTSGNEGDPIIIIRNGQPINSPDEGWLPTVENINNDLSSIYFTSTQKIPINLSSLNFTGIDKKYSPKTPQSYTSPQIILNSGRLILNSTTDSILLSSKKIISLSAIEDIGLSSRGNINLSTKGVRLGGVEANESLMMGDSFIKQFNVLLDSLSLLCDALSTEPVLKSTPLIAVGLNNTIKVIKNLSNTFTSKISKTL
jgi:hypothetical protein